MFGLNKVNTELSINSKLLLNASVESLEQLLQLHDVSPDELRAMMDNIQEWFRKQEHLPHTELHEQVISRLLIMRKFSQEKVKDKIDNYYTVRNKMSELLSRRDPTTPSLARYFQHGCWIVLPKMTPEKHRVTIFRLKSSEDMSVLNLLKVIIMIGDYRLWNDTVMGEQWIFDFEHVTIQLAMQLSPMMISKLVFYLTSCVGPKLKALHLVHLPPHANAALGLFKKLMKAKLVNRMHIHNTFEEAMKKFPKSIFPKDLGGTYEATCKEITDAWKDTLSSSAWRKHFIEQDSIKSDETKRKITSKALDVNFGVEGSFRKLNLD